MKKSFFATALLVTLVGCSKSDTDRMGTAAERDTGTSASSTADTTSIRQRSMTATNDSSGISGSGSVTSANSGAAAGSLESTNNIPQPPPVPQAQQESQQPAANTTGDQSNGDTSNRPAGAPGQTRTNSDNGAQSQPQASPNP
jgi:hypothetical protein